MKNLEITFLSTKENICYAPNYYRSNKIVIIGEKNVSNPKRYAGNYIIDQRSRIHGVDIHVLGGEINLNYKGKSLKLNFGKDYAVVLTIDLSKSIDDYTLVDVKGTLSKNDLEPTESESSSVDTAECEKSVVEPYIAPQIAIEEPIEVEPMSENVLEPIDVSKVVELTPIKPSDPTE